MKFKGRMITAITLVAATPIVSSAVFAATIYKVNFDVSVTSKHTTDFGYELNFQPITFNYVAQILYPPSGIYDAGTRTYTFFDGGPEPLIQSDFISLLPISAQEASAHQAIKGQENDYSDVFLTQIAFSDQRYYDADGLLGQTVSEMWFSNSRPSAGGGGEADGPISDFDLTTLLAIGAKGSFFVFDRIYAAEGGDSMRTTYEGYATVTSISRISEPSTWGSMMIAFLGISLALFRRRLLLESKPLTVVA